MYASGYSRTADRAVSTCRVRDNAHQNRIIRLDSQAGHSPAVTPHKQIVDVHGGPLATSLIAVQHDRKTFTKFAKEPRSYSLLTRADTQDRRGRTESGHSCAS